MNANNALLSWNIGGVAGLVGRADPHPMIQDPVHRYYVTDHLGSIRAVVNTSGTVIEARDYYPYGLMMPGRVYVVADTTREGFTGHELDRETGDYYAGARFYNPAIGRWFVVDPMAEGYAEWSPYNYVFGNPLSLVDPDGRESYSAYSVPSSFVNRNNVDYFSTSGDFLGRRGMPDGAAQTRIMSQEDWEFGQSQGFRDNYYREHSEVASRDNLSLDAASKIFTYYYEAVGYNIRHLENNLIEAALQSGHTTAGEPHGLPPGTIRITIGILDLGVNLLNSYDIMNVMVHEKGSHGRNFLAGRSYTRANRHAWEVRATALQVRHSTWAGTSAAHKSWIYVNYGVHLPANDIVMYFYNHGITCPSRYGCN